MGSLKAERASRSPVRQSWKSKRRSRKPRRNKGEKVRKDNPSNLSLLKEELKRGCASKYIIGSLRGAKPLLIQLTPPPLSKGGG